MAVVKMTVEIEVDVEEVRKQLSFETTEQAQKFLDFALSKIERFFKYDGLWDELKYHLEDYHQEGQNG